MPLTPTQRASYERQAETLRASLARISQANHFRALVQGQLDRVNAVLAGAR